MSKVVVKESIRKIYFENGKSLTLQDVVEVDNSGSYLRLNTKTHYYLINTNKVLYHELLSAEKTF